MDHRFDKINKWIHFALIYLTLNQLEIILFIIFFPKKKKNFMCRVE